ncbi:MAG: putative sensory box/GGDEF family protein [Solirubrobacterales bacterium]|nr:putative sensory box/GGDEF family protein [Solirubrobacterales bacterium]
MSPIRLYVAAVSVVGALAGGLVLSGAAGGPGLTVDATIVALAAAALFSEFFPLTIVRREGNEEVEVSHAFVLAVLLIAGPAPAVAAQLAATLISSLVRRRVAIKAVFNIAQKVAATAAAGAVFAALSGTPALASGDGLTAAEVGSFLLAAFVYQLVNEVAVSIACALAERRPVLSFLLGDMRPAVFNAAVSLTAPLAAAAAVVGAWLVPVLIAPLWGLHKSAAVSLTNFEQARRDALTEIPNAVALREELDAALTGRAVAILMLDLDGFKDINDTLGHQTGDVLLHAVAQRLGEHRADECRLFRLQGDEFVAVMDAPGSGEALAFAAELMRAFQQPFRIGDLEVEVGVSAGIALADRGSCDTDELLRRADVAMYEAKRQRTGFALYGPQSDTANPARQVMAADLRRALAAGELEVHYQPQVTLRTGGVASFEALSRWRRADGTTIPPDHFIPQAEHTGLIMPLTLHVLRTALRDCRRWSDECGFTGRVGINLSARTLHHHSLVADITAALGAAGVPPQRLEVEITESSLMSDPGGARRTLAALHELGVGILIDDFGTGYSSLAYLGTLPVDGIKIDRSFVAGMASDGRDAVIVRSTIDLGHNLGLRVVAEGVEDAGTRDLLAALDVDLAQGWLWSPAVPADRVDVLLADLAGVPFAA